MFTFIDPVQFVILTHHHHTNIHNNIDYNNLIQFLLNIHTKKCISSPYSIKSDIIYNNLVSYSQGNI